jgi:glycosyltransferase involved in cell wall biosynthesis
VGAGSGKRVGILYFSSFACLGKGGQESLFNLISRLDPAVFRAVVIVPQEGSLSERLREISVEVKVLPLLKISVANIVAIAKTLRQVWRIVARQSIDIIHTDGPKNTVYAGFIGRLKHRPVVWHVRSSDHDPYDRLLSLLSSKTILVADALAPRFPASCRKAKCVTIHNGVDIRHFAPAVDSRAERPDFGFHKDDLIVTVTGKVEPLKGQLLLIEACARLHERFPRLLVVVAGEIVDDGFQRQCRMMAEKSGIGDRVRFLGHQQDVRAVLHVSDIFVSPSAQEAFSRAIIEAMAVGLPVVATDAGGAREAVLDGVSGFVVPAESSHALGQKIELLVKSAELRLQMGQEGRKRAARWFDIETNVMKTCQVYAGLIQG